MFSSVSSPACSPWPASAAWTACSPSGAACSWAGWPSAAWASAGCALGWLAFGWLALGRLAFGVVAALVEAGLLERLGHGRARHHADRVALLVVDVAAVGVLALGIGALDIGALGVLALGVLVGALLQGQLVLRGVELGLVLGGLLERQGDAAAVEVDVDHLDGDLLTDADHLLGDVDVALGQLRDVDQALDAVVDADEGAERHQLGHPARDQLADLVGAGELAPRVLLGRLERQRDPLALQVDVQDLDLDLLADLDHLGGVVDVLPGQLGHVHQAVHPAQVHEGPEVDDAGDDALADLALAQGVQERPAGGRLGLLQPGPAGKDHVVAVLVELDDLGLEGAPDIGVQVAHPAHLDQGGGEEAAQADVEDQAALDDLDDGPLDDLVVLLLLLDRAPGPLVLGPLLGQDQAAVLVLLLHDQGLDVVTETDDLVGVDVMLDGQLAGGDDALGLVADVEQHFVAVDLHHVAVDDVALFEGLQRLFVGGREVLGGADIVLRHLGGYPGDVLLGCGGSVGGLGQLLVS